MKQTVDISEWMDRLSVLRDNVGDMKRGSMDESVVRKKLWRAVVDMNTTKSDVASGFLGFCRTPKGNLTDSMLNGLNDEIRKCVRSASDNLDDRPLKSQRQLKKATKIVEDMRVLGEALASKWFES